MKEQHLLVDFENVQPGMEDLLKIAPKLTDVWLFHGPSQIKRAEQLKAAHERVTLVPHSGKGKNALDFHLSFYLGYLAAKHPDANLVVVANDKGYDSMLGHAKLLEFRATRLGFKARKAPGTGGIRPARGQVRFSRRASAAGGRGAHEPQRARVCRRVRTRQHRLCLAASERICARHGGGAAAPFCALCRHAGREAVRHAGAVRCSARGQGTRAQHGHGAAAGFDRPECAHAAKGVAPWLTRIWRC
ncbi:MAG: hypothetical protein KIT86_20590 [Hydrogenophaga sp.]|nr:hypothetical protein [Hydrogenophaga sp.]